ncbi:Centrosomal protein of 120 kDa [Hondaea fermentalgiana]|uniref:Centrosomal protein of 120 kDa n=1 Tax=Hondaea fermentalgiana TaxID=2315210 RepID=A0A2R5G7W4_9STRA|nr:Centrosomal protein of 120 kDa [Hondaea fermentalgiana]|eukprot:GBG26635.1 Centrosomal protein of 120 kDa [Hondaea fermentalgiana]
MAQALAHEGRGRRGRKFFEVRVLEVQGVPTPAPGEACIVQVVVDGLRARSGPGTSTRSNAYAWRVEEDAGLLQWAFREADLTRLQVHEPRVRVEVFFGESSIGSSQFDLRDLNFRRDSCSQLRKNLELASAYGQQQANILFEVGIRTPTEADAMASSRVSAEASARPSVGSGLGGWDDFGDGDDAPLGMALGEEHVLIGSSGSLNMTLYITLMGLSGTQALLRATQATLEGVSRFWIEYHIFGVQVETEAFPSLKYARFAPIRDSFQIRSSREDVARFLCSTPIRVYLCCAGEDIKRKRSRRLVLASTLLRFNPLFTSGTNFVQATSNCAFSLEAHAPYEMQLRPGESYPSMAVSLELHVEGKVSKVVLQDEATETAHTPSKRQDEAIQTDQVATPHRMSARDHFELEVLSFDLDPNGDAFDEDDEADAIAKKEETDVDVRLVLHVPGTSQRAMSSATFHMDEYGQIEQAKVDGVRMHVLRGQLSEAVLECQLADGSIAIAHGEFAESAEMADPSRGGTVAERDEEFATLRLFDRAGMARGSAQVRRRALRPRETPGNIPVPVSPMAPVSQDTTVYHYRMTIDLRSIKGLEQAYNVYLQYMYPLFGMTHSIQTRPPILVDRFSERIVPHGLNLFQFKISRAALERSARSEPLVVEMWNRDQYAADTRLGFCALPLRKLLEARPYFQWSGQTFATLSELERYRERFLGSRAPKEATRARDAERTRKQLDVPPLQVQVLETDLMICAFEQHEDGATSSGVKRIATVRCTCTLENLGEVEQEKMPRHPRSRASSRAGQQMQQRIKTEEKQQQHDGNRVGTASSKQSELSQDEEEILSAAEEAGDDANDASPATSPARSGRSTRRNVSEREAAELAARRADLEAREAQILAQEEEAAQVFEQWKQDATKRWEAEMRNRESARMSSLEQEWALREHERAKTIKVAQEEYKQLEVRMHRAITDAERRERAVARLETELQRAADQRLADLEVMHRRAREESQHKVNLHKERVSALEDEVKRVRAALGKTEKRLNKVENEYADFREKTRQSPEASLQKEIAVLQGQNADLHARLEQEKERTAAEALEKETIKAQLVQVARELQRQMHANSSRAERELDNLRLEYLAREERFVLDGDRKQLMDLRQELNELRAATLRGPVSSSAVENLPAATRSRWPQDPPTPLSVSASSRASGREGPRRRQEVVVNSSDQEAERSRQDTLERLLQERDDLLRTGVYDRNHPLVVQLEEHIEMARNASFA